MNKARQKSDDTYPLTIRVTYKEFKISFVEGIFMICVDSEAFLSIPDDEVISIQIPTISLPAEGTVLKSKAYPEGNGVKIPLQLCENLPELEKFANFHCTGIIKYDDANLFDRIFKKTFRKP